MTAGAIAHHRLRNLQIALATCKQAGEVLLSLGAVQAQDYASALWAMGLRLPQATETDIEQAIADRTIVRTWLMRGTLHFVAAADINWMLKFLTPRTIAQAARRNQQLELDETTFIRCEKVFVRALQGGNQLTREEMFALLQRDRIAVHSQRGYHILWRLAQESILCFGTRQGKRQTFALLDEWVPRGPSLETDAALTELALRYFCGHGPATLADFVGWAGLKVSEARAGIEMASSRLARETIEGKVYWMPPGSPALHLNSSSVYLLPGFDEYILGYQDRSASLDAQYAQRIVPGGNGIFLPTIVSNGRVVGTWKRVLKKKSLAIIASPFRALTKTEKRSCDVAAERYGRFLDLTSPAKFEVEESIRFERSNSPRQ
jgi:hypothetical protein